MTKDIDRRAFLKRTGLAAAGLGVLGTPAFLAACSSSTSTKTAAPAKGTSAATSSGPVKPITNLTIPFLAEMQVPDPDIFYEGEGLQVTLSCYEGLVQYTPVPPGSPLVYHPPSGRISPNLAHAWEISADGLTYTFHLVPNVKFHDGTLADAASWQKTFIRRGLVNQGPAYMVTPVASTAAPDPVTFVVKLKHPVDPFLDYMACPWSPKATSPTTVAQHTVKNDLAQGWLTTHDAGTGAYMITEFVPSDHYTLEVFPGYWGTAPEVQKVTIPIIPAVQTQQLKMRSGELDMITKGLPTRDVQTLEKDSKFTVDLFPVCYVESLYFNPTKGRIFDSVEVRQAVRSAINRKELIGPVYGNTAQLSTQFYPPGAFPDGAAPDDPTYDPSLLAKIIKTLPSKKVDLAYGLEGGATSNLLGELIQTQLSAQGLQVTVRGIPTSQEFSLYNTPDTQRPDILIDVWGGDAIHVDTDVRIFFRTGAAPLNWFDYSIPAADQAMDMAAQSTVPSTVTQGYAQTGRDISDQGYLLNIAATDDVIISRAGITNIIHDPGTSQVVRIKDLKAG